MVVVVAEVVVVVVMAVSLVSAMMERQGFGKSESDRVSDWKDGCDLRVQGKWGKWGRGRPTPDCKRQNKSL